MGGKIIAGEQNRISNGGGNPIYCPSIALVKSIMKISKKTIPAKNSSRIIQPGKAGMSLNTGMMPMP